MTYSKGKSREDLIYNYKFKNIYPEPILNRICVEPIVT